MGMHCHSELRTTMAAPSPHKKTMKKVKDNVAPPRRCGRLRRPESIKAAKEEVEMEDLMFPIDRGQRIRESLLAWYDVNRRDLPWRRFDDQEEETRGYGVWVSEVMLQQTRVQTVIDYYNRWMHRWPTLHHLSLASIEEVNEMWAGLGYYRRARFLLEGAKMIAGGACGFPKTVPALRKIPGIGEYTAGAIASIAFKEVVPVVDGNVIRVIARLKAISANPKDSSTIKKFWSLAAQLVDSSRPGDFNQALMELGATVCTTLSPSCSSCPISAHCQVVSLSRQDSSVSVTDYPVKTVKIKQRNDFSAVCVVEILVDQETSEDIQSSNIFLLVKRPDEGLLAGLWEFPSVMLSGEVESINRREAIDNFLKKYFALEPRKTYDKVSREDVGEFVHIFTHIRLKIFVELLVLRLRGGVDQFVEMQNQEPILWKFVDSKVISSMGLTSGVSKVYRLVEKFKLNKTSSCHGQPKRRRRQSTQTVDDHRLAGLN